MPNPVSEEVNIERAAILIMSLSTEQAAKILRHLGPKQIQKLGTAMAQLKGVEQGKLHTIMKTFIDEADKQTNIGVNNDEHIRKILYQALGEEKASGIVDRILQGANTKGLDTLRWMDPKTVAELIKNEHPQIQTIILSYLDPDQAGSVLNNFDEKVRLDLIMRIAKQDQIQPSALQELNAMIERQFNGTSGSQMHTVGGVKRAADIMNFLGSSSETAVLDGIKEKDPDLGQSIQDLMFVFENILELDDRSVQAVLKEISSDTLVLALKGADNAMRDKIFSNMSKRAGELLKDDLEAKGPVRLSEVENAQKEILGVARKLADAGEIVLGGKGGEPMI